MASGLRWCDNCLLLFPPPAAQPFLGLFSHSAFTEAAGANSRGLAFFFHFILVQVHQFLSRKELKPGVLIFPALRIIHSENPFSLES